MFKIKYLAATLAMGFSIWAGCTLPAFAQNKPRKSKAKADSTSTSTVDIADADINLGYILIKRKKVTGSLSAIQGSHFNELSGVSISSLMQGQLPGVQVVNSSGAVGSGALVNIRGINTLNAGSTPLYLLDGVPVKSSRIANPIGRNADHDPLADINPGDIASVTVLKDAQSTAIYGMRGSNGVVLIDTYGGTTGKTMLDVSLFSGITNQPKDQSVFNADEYRAYTLEKEQLRGLTPAQINAGVGRYLLLSTPDNQKLRYSNNTNWQDEIKRDGAYSDFHFNLRGGDAITRYSVNTGFTRQTGAVNNTDFSRFSTRFNLDYKVGRKLSFINSLAYSQTEKNLNDGGNSLLTNPLFLSMVKSPTLGIYLPNLDGLTLTRDLDSADYAGRNNPFSAAERMINRAVSNKITGRITAQYSFSPYLNLRVGISADWARLSEKRFRPSAGFALEENVIREASAQSSIELMGLNENVLSYNRTYDNNRHSVAAFVGTSVQTTSLDSKYGVYINSPSDQLTTASTDNARFIDTIGGYRPTTNLVSAFTGVQYAFLEKYLVGATLRADGSSRFSQGNRWGYFPSVSLGWLVSSEPFLQNSKVVSELKIRSSFGITGNQEVGYTNAFNAATPAGYFRYPAVKFGSLGATNFTWEETRQFNAGLDLSLFSGIIGVTGDFYVKNTSNLYNRVNLPAISGFKSYPVNSGEIENSGVEIGLSVNVVKRKFKWTTGLSGAYNKNTILSLPENIEQVTTYGDFSGIAQAGSSVGAFYGYNAIGIYQYSTDVKVKNGSTDANPFKGGDIIFEDVDKNGIIDENDRKVLGKSTPDFFGGFSNTFSYKNIDLNVFMDFSLGSEVYNGQRAALEAMSTYDNQSTTINARWRNEGDVTNMPRLLHGDAVGNTRFSSRWIEDGSYVRFKAVSLGYTLPNRAFKGVFKSARVVLTGQNLYTFSDNKALNPEFANVNNAIMYGQTYGHLPQLRSFLLGIKLGL